MGIQAPAEVKYALICEATLRDNNLLKIGKLCQIAGVSSHTRMYKHRSMTGSTTTTRIVVNGVFSNVLLLSTTTTSLQGTIHFLSTKSLNLRGSAPDPEVYRSPFPRGSLTPRNRKRQYRVHCLSQTRYGAQDAPQRCLILHIGKARLL